MKYIVKTKGKVYEHRQKAYAIEAESIEEAEKAAYEKFNKEFDVADNELSTSAGAVKYRTYIALGALALAVVIGMIGFKIPQTLRSPLTVRPDLKSCLYGAGIYLVLLFKMKGLTNTFKNWMDVVLAVLMSLLFGSLLQLLIARMPFASFFTMIKVDIRLFVLGLAVIAWLGSGLLSLICLAIILMLISYSVSHLGSVMLNVKGILYLVCAAAGIIAYVASLPSFHQGIMDVKAKLAALKKAS